MNIPRTLEEWCTIFGLELIDPDGFRDIDWLEARLEIQDFLNGIYECTVRIEDYTRYEVLTDILTPRKRSEKKQ